MLEALGELFVKHRGLGFKRGSSKDISIKLTSGADAVDLALKIVSDYYELFLEINSSQEEK